MPRIARILSFRKSLQKGVLHDGYGKKPIPWASYISSLEVIRKMT